MKKAIQQLKKLSEEYEKLQIECVKAMEWGMSDGFKRANEMLKKVIKEL